MTIIWFIYYTIQLIKGRDEESDAIAIIPARLLDVIIIASIQLFIKGGL